MDKESFKFLKDLVESVSPSGYEEEAAILWKDYVSRFTEKVRVDIHGNVIASVGGGGPKVMLCGHIDEIGYMVKYIDDNGYLYFSSIGGIDTALLGGRKVIIKTSKGRVIGVIGKKAIHLQTKEEASKSLKTSDFWIDIGAKDKKQAQEMVKIGDVAVPYVQLSELHNNLISSKSLDDKTGAFVSAEALKRLSKEKLPAEVFSVATVQEEIGLRGARTSAFGISPEIGIAIDVTFATDHPGGEKKRVGDIALGKGPVLAKGPNINPKVFSLLQNAAEAKRIPYQIEAISSATGTDANVIQLTKSGVAAALISIPCRYMHTPAEVVSTEDMDNAVALIAEFVSSLREGQNFIPF